MKELIKYTLLWVIVLTILFVCTKYDNAEGVEIEPPTFSEEMAEQICNAEGI